ncbi:MAG: response regulator transcription factor [Vulcanimicrobiaceae bacterium]
MTQLGLQVARQSVLIVDDEVGLVEILRVYLQDEGFDVIAAGDGVSGLDLALSQQPDIVLLDLNLPQLSGIQAFRRMRLSSNIPVIMISSRVAEVDRVLGLELGADDYISKPFSPREVVARVRAVLRRTRDVPNRRMSAVPSGSDVTQVGNVEIDRLAHEVRRSGVTIDLTPTEFRVLDVLASQVGRAFARDQILERVADGEVYDRTLDRHIANLRHKIEDQPSRPSLIVTVVGVGYKLVAPGGPRCVP